MVDVDADDAVVVPKDAATDEPAELLLFSTFILDDVSVALLTPSLAPDDDDTTDCD